MSQEIVRGLLMELGGGATIRELSDLAQKKYPNQTLHTYVSQRLQPLERKGYIERVDDSGETRWSLTEKGRTDSIQTPLSELGSVISEEQINKEGFEIANLVGSLRLGRELDLSALSADIPNTEYNPETYPSMIYRVSDVAAEGDMSVLTPSSGRLAIVGAKSKNELVEGTQEFLETLKSLGVEIDKASDDLLVQNIVANYDLARELDLSVLAITLNLERVEYEPEQFPGLVYRTSRNATVLIFASGKCVITGAKTFLGLLDSRDEIIEKIDGIEIEV